MAETTHLDGGVFVEQDGDVLHVGTASEQPATLDETDLERLSDLSKDTSIIVGSGDDAVLAEREDSRLIMLYDRDHSHIVTLVTYDNIPDMLDMLRTDPYDEQFAVLENIAEDVFERPYRDAVEVIDTRGVGGTHNAAVVLEPNEPWNVSDEPISNLFTDFDVRYIRTGGNDTYGYEMDEVGLMVFVQLEA